MVFIYVRIQQLHTPLFGPINGFFRIPKEFFNEIAIAKDQFALPVVYQPIRNVLQLNKRFILLENLGIHFE